MAMKKVTGWYEEHDRSSDYTGQLVNFYTGELYTPPSMTKQEFVAECDINNIIREYTMTGAITHITALAKQGAFLDLPDSMDYQESLHTVMAAKAVFEQLPSRIRTRFENDPEQFLAFTGDEANREEMYELGLAVRPAPEPESSSPSAPAPEPPPSK